MASGLKGNVSAFARPCPGSRRDADMDLNIYCSHLESMSSINTSVPSEKSHIPSPIPQEEQSIGATLASCFLRHISNECTGQGFVSLVLQPSPIAAQKKPTANDARVYQDSLYTTYSL